MIVVIDDFITDENLLKEIENDKSFFQDPGHYYYWKGWWNGEANTTKKKLIEYIWKYNCPINKLYTINFNKLFFMVSYFISLLNHFFSYFNSVSSCNFKQ